MTTLKSVPVIEANHHSLLSGTNVMASSYSF